VLKLTIGGQPLFDFPRARLYTPQGRIGDELCPDCNFHPCCWAISSDHIIHNVKSMRSGYVYGNNERRFLAYRVCYYVLHQGYSASHERIRLPDYMTNAIKREWPNPPGEEYTGFIRRRRRRLHTVKLQIQPSRNPPPPPPPPPSPGQTATRVNSSTGHHRRRQLRLKTTNKG
jgi:hypothetical protein